MQDFIHCMSGVEGKEEGGGLIEVQWVELETCLVIILFIRFHRLVKYDSTGRIYLFPHILFNISLIVCRQRFIEYFLQSL